MGALSFLAKAAGSCLAARPNSIGLIGSGYQA